jgi:hypothetical protein
VLAPRRAASAELDSASIRTPTIMEFFSIGTLLASLTEAHIAKGDLRHTDSRQQRDSLLFCPWAALAN